MISDLDTKALGTLLAELGHNGITLSLRSGATIHVGLKPRREQFSLQIRAHNDAILTLLTAGFHPVDRKTRDILIERIRVAKELGLATHAGSPAWLTAVGESLALCCR
jgi:hypothetical protein